MSNDPQKIPAGPGPDVPQLFGPEEDSIWKKYSSNHEFPLAVATSVILHIFVAMLVAIAGVWLFNFGTGGPPDLEAITFGGGGGSGEGAGDPKGPEINQDPVSLNQDAQETDKQEIKIDPNMLALPSDEATRLIDKAKETDQQLAKGDNDPSRLAGDRGRGGSGRGGGKGEGFGRGEGDGIGDGKQSARERRKDRWEILLPMSDSAQFKRKLAEIQAIVMVPESPGHYLLFDMTEASPKAKPAVFQDIIKMNRIWYTNRLAVVCQGIADELGLPNRPEFFAVFVPQDLETEMFRKELAYRGLSEEEIIKRKLKTKFDVSRAGGGWNVTVRDQAARPD